MNRKLPKRIFIDTNIFLRFWEGEGERYLVAKEFFERIEKGEFIPYISSVVFSEIFYVLKSIYGVETSQIVRALKKIFKLRGLVVIKESFSEEVLECIEKYNQKVSDCLIMTQLPSNVVLVTWDRGILKRCKRAIAPEELLK